MAEQGEYSYKAGLDNFALVQVEQNVQHARVAVVQALESGDTTQYEVALEFLDAAWSGLPGFVRDLVPRGPKQEFERRAEEEVPADEVLEADPSFDEYSPQNRGRYRHILAVEILKEVVSEYQRKITDALQDQNLLLKVRNMYSKKDYPTHGKGNWNSKVSKAQAQGK